MGPFDSDFWTPEGWDFGLVDVNGFDRIILALRIPRDFKAEFKGEVK
ncbi:MAG: hypothetical protein QXH24_01285 [Candidatus Bathyarchaeia archaeon]